MAKKKVTFTIDDRLVDLQQSLSKTFTAINWSEYIELFMAACLAYLGAAEQSFKEGKLKRPYDVRLPAELQVSFIMSCLVEEFEALKSPDLFDEQEFVQKHHDLLTSRVHGSVMREWEEAFNKVYTTRTFPKFGNIEPRNKSKPSSTNVVVMDDQVYQADQETS